jgi:hypothetical protein
MQCSGISMDSRLVLPDDGRGIYNGGCIGVTGIGLHPTATRGNPAAQAGVFTA